MMLNISIFVLLEWEIILADILERGINLSFIWESGKFLNWYKDKTSACLLMHIILKIIYGLGMGCFYLNQWLLPEPPSEINYSFHAFFLCNDLLGDWRYIISSNFIWKSLLSFWSVLYVTPSHFHKLRSKQNFLI